MFGNIKITNFAKRQFNVKNPSVIFPYNSSGSKFINITPEEFEEAVNLTVKSTTIRAKILDGYAPFCKLIVIKNFTDGKVGSVPIDITNYQYIQHEYRSRSEGELAVLSRSLIMPLSVSVQIAEYLVVVVYSKEQLKKEHEAELKEKFSSYEKKKGVVLSEEDRKAMSEIEGFKFELGETDEWGIVTILCQSHPNEEPMLPITMMRNALGIEEGGSGFPLDKVKYQESVDFWSKNVIIKHN